ncbi:MAG: DUF1566 domain-containing protein, partial [Candidatus Liptonbacteria bacterium]|nr:DUF1566 domain-containing protein [Candidatus Liptonbacteria bacterium]
GIWTECTSANSFCSTSLSSAHYRDESTGLIWSKPCNGAGCDSFSTSSPLTYAWASSTTNANNFSTAQSATSTASGLCTNGDHAESGWSLPHQKQLMQAYIDGAYGNVEDLASTRRYWSATTASHATASAWDTEFSRGVTQATAKATTALNVRCVR